MEVRSGGSIGFVTSVVGILVAVKTFPGDPLTISGERDPLAILEVEGHKSIHLEILKCPLRQALLHH